MADIRPSTASPVTQEAFVADRMKFWHTFTHFTVGTVITMAVLLIGMAIFLV
jgi:hypothetical protein